jgi:hypothetical protein
LVVADVRRQPDIPPLRRWDTRRGKRDKKASRREAGVSNMKESLALIEARGDSASDQADRFLDGIHK